MPRNRSAVNVNLPPRLVRLIEAARAAKPATEGRETGAVANALEDFGVLGAWVIPFHGVFVPNDSDVCTAVDKVARAHLGLDHARRELRRSLKVVESFEQRDAIESALNQVRSAYDEAYFYAGLAFGITLADRS